MAQYEDLLRNLLYRGGPMHPQQMPFSGPPMQAQTMPYVQPTPPGGLWGGMMGSQTPPPAQPSGGVFSFPSAGNMMDMRMPQQSPQQRIDSGFAAFPQSQQYEQPVANPTQDQMAQLNALMNFMGQQRR